MPSPCTMPVRPTVYLDITINGGNAGRLQFELYNDLAPKAAENFRALCTGEKGIGKNGKPLHLKGSRFYRIKPGAEIQGGDIVKGDGSSGESIYNGKTFGDDKCSYKHLGMGILSTGPANGRKQNDSRFNITLANADWLDKKCVVFGKMIHGRTCLLEMESMGSFNGLPTREVKIVGCGELKDERVDKKYHRGA